MGKFLSIWGLRVSEVLAGSWRFSITKMISILPETVKGQAFSVTAVKSGASQDEDPLYGMVCQILTQYLKRGLVLSWLVCGSCFCPSCCRSSMGFGTSEW
jgi:hypothetical protein